MHEPRLARKTAARRAIAELIARQSGHFTAADLERAARDAKVRVGRATIFRTLDLLVEQGGLERIDLPSGAHTYVACEAARHHHHIVCRVCGKSVEVADSGMQQAIERIGSLTGYRVEQHRLELFGLCPECAA